MRTHARKPARTADRWTIEDVAVAMLLAAVVACIGFMLTCATIAVTGRATVASLADTAGVHVTR